VAARARLSVLASPYLSARSRLPVPVWPFRPSRTRIAVPDGRPRQMPPPSSTGTL